MGILQTPSHQLPIEEPKLFLPKEHVHLFAQVVLVVVGGIALAAGLFLFIIGSGSSPIETPVQSTVTDENMKVLFFLASGGLMGIGVTLLSVWALWKFTLKNRIRFLISLAASTLAIIIGLLSIDVNAPHSAIGYTLYFFCLTFGLLTGLASITFFFIGFSRHLIGGAILGGKQANQQKT